jgi:hypothetical protein
MNMIKALSKKSKKTIERIETINADIKSHKKNIRLLNSYARGYVVSKRAEYAPRLIKYSCIPKCEKRYRWTLQNITTQISLLEQELATLIEYGA